MDVAPTVCQSVDRCQDDTAEMKGFERVARVVILVDRAACVFERRGSVGGGGGGGGGGGVEGRRRRRVMEVYVMPGPHQRDTRHGSLLGADIFHMDLGTVSVFTCADPQGLFQSPQLRQEPSGKEGGMCAEDPTKSSPGKNQYGANGSTCQYDRWVSQTHGHVGPRNTLRTR